MDELGEEAGAAVGEFPAETGVGWIEEASAAATVCGGSRVVESCCRNVSSARDICDM